MFELNFLTELIVLFLTAFLAATLLPLGSEVMLLGLISLHPELAFLAWLSATLGNTLGGLTNWLLGKCCLHFQERCWFPLSSKRLKQVQRLFRRYGQPVLLLSWLPVIGDGLCLAAGIARLKLLNCIFWVLLGKGLRYAVLIWGTKAAFLS